MDELKERYRQNTPKALGLDNPLENFPRHRWTGAHEVLCPFTVFIGTHGIFQPCLFLWLGVTLEVPRLPKLALGYVSSDSESDDKAELLLQLQTDVADNKEDEAKDTSKKTAEFHAKKKNK